MDTLVVVMDKPVLEQLVPLAGAGSRTKTWLESVVVDKIAVVAAAVHKTAVVDVVAGGKKLVAADSFQTVHDRLMADF